VVREVEAVRVENVDKDVWDVEEVGGLDDKVDSFCDRD